MYSSNVLTSLPTSRSKIVSARPAAKNNPRDPTSTVWEPWHQVAPACTEILGFLVEFSWAVFDRRSAAGYRSKTWGLCCV